LKNIHLRFDVRQKVLNLWFILNNIDGLRVGVVADAERARNLFCPITKLLLGIGEALCQKISWLVSGDGVFLQRRFFRIERKNRRLIAQAVSQLSERRQQTGAESLRFAILFAESEFDGEPVEGGEFFYPFVRGAQRQKTNLLRELGEGRVGEERNVPQQLVTNVRLRRVQRLGSVSNVLRRMKDSEGKSGEEIPWTKKSGDGTQAESSAVLQEFGDILQLRDVVLVVAAVVLQEGKDVVEFAAGVSLVQRGQVDEDFAPRRHFRLRVRHAGHRRTVLVSEGDVGKLLPSLAVDLVREAGMVGVEFRAICQDLMGETVQVADLAREPRNRISIRVRLGSGLNRHISEEFILAKLIQSRLQIAFSVVDGGVEVVDADDWLRRSRFDVNQVDIVRLENFQRRRQRPDFLVDTKENGSAAFRVFEVRFVVCWNIEAVGVKSVGVAHDIDLLVLIWAVGVGSIHRQEIRASNGKEWASDADDSGVRW